MWSTDSLSWYEDWLQVYGGDGFNDTHGYVKLDKNPKGRLHTIDYDWHTSEKFRDLIESKHTKYATRLHGRW